MNLNKTQNKLPPLNFYDSYKLVFDLWLKPSIEFFLPIIYKHIDWNKNYVYLEDELSKISSSDKKIRLINLSSLHYEMKRKYYYFFI